MLRSCTCGSSGVTVNATTGGYDPTRTTTLRNRFSAEMYRRFNGLAGLIRRAIVEQDCFGLRERRSLSTAAVGDMNLPGQRAFAFSRDSAKVEGFMNWLREQEQAGILEVTSRRQLGAAVEGAWTDTYIRSSYQRGLSRARRELRGAGYDVASVDSLPGGVRELFYQPVHADRAGLLYTRTFNELRGITGEMDQQISRILSEGIASGQSPETLARWVNSTINLPRVTVRIPGVGPRRLTSIQRARTLARTEVIRAHHVATIQEYRNAGTVGVRLRAEFATAGDALVCPVCAMMEGRTYALREAEGMIPVHPNCRCIMLPLDKEENERAIARSSPSPRTTPPKAASSYQSYVSADAAYKGLISESFGAMGEGTLEALGSRVVTLDGTISRVYRRGTAIEELTIDQLTQARGALVDYFGDAFRAGRLNIKNPTLKKVLSSDGRTSEIAEDVRDAVREVERVADRLDTLNDARRGAWVKYVEELPKEEYRWVRGEMVLSRVTKMEGDLEITPFVESIFEQGTRNIPDDIFFELHKTAGINYRLNPGWGRASQGMGNINLYYNQLNRSTISHEVGHAVDAFLQGRGDGRWSFGRSGFLWGDSRWVTRAEAEDYRSWFREKLTGEVGVYENGDGRFWKDNWIDDYEGRIYLDDTLGEEWWAMNSQRHNGYYVSVDGLDEIYDRAEEIIQAELQRKGLSTLDEFDKGSLSRIGSVIKRDQKVIDLFSENFSGRMRSDWARGALDEAYVEALHRAGKEVPSGLRVRGMWRDIDVSVQNMNGNAEAWDIARSRYPELTEWMDGRIYKGIDYTRSKRRYLSRFMRGAGEDVVEEVAENRPMTAIGRMTRCLLPSSITSNTPSTLSKPDPCRDYVRGEDGKWYFGGAEVAEDVAKQLDDMRIPPAWRNVVVSADPAKKVQAIGLDSAGRWQYRYSAEHIAAKAQEKFERVKGFSRDMPSIRRGMDDGIAAGDPRAYALRLEDSTAIRAGSRTDFKAKKKAYGLTTLKKEHIRVDGDRVTLDFVAKEGIPAHYELNDPVLARWLREERLPTLSADDMIFHDVSADRLNDYIKELAGGKKYSLKDFRTYHGTRIAYEELKGYAGVEMTAAQKKALVKEVSTTVSQFLKNTPTMAKNSYIDPRVWDFIGGLP